MKKLSISVLRAVIAIVLFTGVSVALSTAGVSSINEAKAAVSAQQVTYYLECRGYSVISLTQTFTTRATSDNWQAHTIINGVHYTTTVFVQGTQIVGHENIPM